MLDDSGGGGSECFGASAIKCWWLPRKLLACYSLSLISRDGSSCGDAGWADHAVPHVQGYLRVHADILIYGVR